MYDIVNNIANHILIYIFIFISDTYEWFDPKGKKIILISNLDYVKGVKNSIPIWFWYTKLMINVKTLFSRLQSRRV